MNNDNVLNNVLNNDSNNESNYGYKKFNSESKIGQWSKNKTQKNLKQREWEQNPFFIEESLKEFQKNQSTTYFETPIKNTFTQKEKNENTQNDLEAMDITNSNLDNDYTKIIKCIDDSEFSNSWLSQWLKYRMKNDRISDQSKKYWTTFCFEYGESILELEKYINNRDDKKQFRIFVMKKIESYNLNDSQQNSNYFMAKSRPLLPQLSGIPQFNQKNIPSFESLYLQFKLKIEEYSGFKLSFENKEDLKRQIGYDSMHIIKDDDIKPLIEIKKQLTSTRKIAQMNPDNVIQNREEQNIDLQHIPLSRRTINNALQPNRDKYRLVRESFS